VERNSGVSRMSARRSPAITQGTNCSQHAFSNRSNQLRACPNTRRSRDALTCWLRYPFDQ